MTNLLEPGDTFPLLSVSLVGDDTLQLPAALDGHYGVVLFFRGAWCPYCNAQLRAFQRAQDKLATLDIRVVALSVDNEDDTRALVAQNGISYPIGHSAAADAIAAVTGAFVNPEPAFLQSTGFVLDPSGRVLVSVYSSGAIGRLMPDDVSGLVRYLREQQQELNIP